jgi:L-aspartate oxidase
MSSGFDAIVVGAGIAGLRAAIELSDRGARVAVVTKDSPEASSSGLARGGIAVALSGDEPELTLHEEDTLRAGAGLCDEPAVRALVRDGHDEVWKLISWGARFDREGDRYHLTREAAHSMPRILHAGGDATGRELIRTLVERVRGRPNVVRYKAATALGLLLSGERCVGVRALSGNGTTFDLRGRAVLLSTGGIGHCWSVTSNPEDATGDGLALALRAGCRLADMEFVQFHPTALAVEGAPAWLLTEALRGEGGEIVNARGERFLFAHDARGELASRDVVARGIAIEMRRQQREPVRLDLRPLGRERLERRFPGVVELCRQLGLDPLNEPLPIRPAAHYAMGGVVTDLQGRTECPGLYAAGEVASTGVHGANRLASNSLLEGLVFGARAARRMLEESAGPVGSLEVALGPAALGDPARRETLRELASASLGIVRRAEGMARVVERLEAWTASWASESRPWTREAFEVGSQAAVLRAVAACALWRRESRGAHFREDCPRPDPARGARHSRIGLSGVVSSSPVRLLPRADSATGRC